MFNRVAMNLALSGLVALSIGSAVYLIDRPAGLVLLPYSFVAASGRPGASLFGTLGGQLPSFLHIYAFALLSAGVLHDSRVSAESICIAWLIPECLFEVGQHPVLSVVLISLLPSSWGDLPGLALIPNYFLLGTFDPLDLLALVAGALAAVLSIRLIRTRRYVDS